MTNKKALKAKITEVKEDQAIAERKYQQTEIGSYYVQGQKLREAAHHLEVALDFIEAANDYEYEATK